MKVNSLDTFHRSLEEGGGDPCYVVDSATYDLSLHIVSIFVLFVASALGVGLPLVPKYSKKLKTYPYLVVLGKCAGAGVMISCALVHMLLPSTEALTSECLPAIFTTYPAFSYAFALFAALTSHLTEHFIEESIASRGESINEPRDDTDHNPGDFRLKESNCDDKLVVHSGEVDGSADNDTQLQMAKQYSETLVVELSLSIHSILVGFALGITFDKSFEALLVALVFHQMLEGVALGCRLADSMLGFFHEIKFSIIFSLSCPIGIIIGISAYRTVNQTGQTFLLLQGIFDGICSGLLLYNGFLLLFHDFNQDMAKHCCGDRRNHKKFGMFAALWIAAFAMSLIGAWA